MNSNYTLILGSKSPRRQELLKKANLKFRVTTLDCNESFPETLNPKKAALFLAEKKSKSYKKKFKSGEILITADTIVALKGEIMGKPSNSAEASAMLKKLSGKTHKVISGVCLRSGSKKISFADETEVTFKRLSPEEISFYVSRFKPFDKAGAYGIQEWIGLVGVRSIKGSYFNVVGLPIQKLIIELQKF